MTLLIWILFGVLNGLILFYLEPFKSRGEILPSALMGVLGSISGGAFAYLLFGGELTALNLPLMILLLMESILFFIIYTSKTFKKAI